MSNKKTDEVVVGRSSVDDTGRIILSIMGMDQNLDCKNILVYKDCFINDFDSSKLCNEVLSRYGVDLGWFFSFRKVSEIRDVNLFSYCKALTLEINGSGQVTLEKIKGEVMNFVNIPYEECYDNMYIYDELSFSELDILQFTCYLEDKYSVNMPEDINIEITKNTKDISLSDFSRLICNKINNRKH